MQKYSAHPKSGRDPADFFVNSQKCRKHGLSPRDSFGKWGVCVKSNRKEHPTVWLLNGSLAHVFSPSLAPLILGSAFPHTVQDPLSSHLVECFWVCIYCSVQKSRATEQMLHISSKSRNCNSTIRNTLVQRAAPLGPGLHYFHSPRKNLGKVLCPVCFWQTH